MNSSRIEAASSALIEAGINPIVITVPAGEKSKSLKQVGECYDALAKHRLERKSFVVALGGGVRPVSEIAAMLVLVSDDVNGVTRIYHDTSFSTDGSAAMCASIGDLVVTLGGEIEEERQALKAIRGLYPLELKALGDNDDLPRPERAISTSAAQPQASADARAEDERAGGLETRIAGPI